MVVKEYNIKKVKNSESHNIDTNNLTQDCLDLTHIYAEFRKVTNNKSEDTYKKIPVYGRIKNIFTGEIHLVTRQSMEKLIAHGYVRNMMLKNIHTIDSHSRKVEFLGLNECTYVDVNELDNNETAVEIDNGLRTVGNLSHKITGAIFVIGNNKPQFFKTETRAGEFIKTRDEYKELTELRGTEKEPVWFVDKETGTRAATSARLCWDYYNEASESLQNKMVKPKIGTPYITYSVIDIDASLEMSKIKVKNEQIHTTYLMIPILNKIETTKTKLSKTLSERIKENIDKFEIIKINGEGLDLVNLLKVMRDNFDKIREYGVDELIDFIEENTNNNIKLYRENNTCIGTNCNYDAAREDIEHYVGEDKPEEDKPEEDKPEEDKPEEDKPEDMNNHSNNEAALVKFKWGKTNANSCIIHFNIDGISGTIECSEIKCDDFVNKKYSEHYISNVIFAINKVFALANEVNRKYYINNVVKNLGLVED